MLYFFGVRTLGSDKYKLTGNCLQSQFQQVLKEAGKMRELKGQRIFVDFRAHPHTFEVKVNNAGKVETHLMTPEVESVGSDMNIAQQISTIPQITDPALEAQFEGS